MRRIITTALLLASFAGIHAQKEIPVFLNQKPAGINLVTGNEIIAQERIFPETIFGCYIDTTRNMATIQLRKTNGRWMKPTGNLVYFDLVSNRERWVRKISYQLNNLLQENEVLVVTSQQKSWRVDMNSGKNQWQTPHQVLYINKATGIALGYPVNFPDNNKKLMAINLADGQLRWFHGVNREYGWNDLFPLNDSVIMICASGLHTMDLESGFGWDYDAVTGSKDYTSTILINSAGILVGMFTGTFYTYTGYDVVTDVTSNTWIDTTGIYFASKDKIARLDQNGQKIWVTELPKKKASKSSLFIQDTVVYMVNFGYAFFSGKQSDVGDPFVAAFGTKSGKQLFMNFNEDEHDQVSDYIIGNGEIIALYKDMITSYSMVDGTVIRQMKIPSEITGNAISFSTGQFFTESDSGFIPIEDLNPGKFFLVTDSMKMLTLNSEFSIDKTADIKEFFTLTFTDDHLKFYSRNNQVFVSDVENRKIAQISASPKAFIAGKKLYDISGRNMLEIDLIGLYSLP